MRIATLTLLAAALGGCASAPRVEPPEALPQPELQAPARQVNGAIFQTGYDVRLYEDRTARRVGDIVTVVLEEETDARKAAETNLDKSFDMSMAAPTLLGHIPTYRGEPISVEVAAERDFEGGGDSSQSNELSGTLTATVVRVEPNGNLVIQGQKRLTLNRGDEYVTITGVVRPEDVGADNTVSSTRVASARISYTGTGALADSNTVGWLSRVFFSVLWPF